MIDIFAGLSLATAASKMENPGQLFSDVERLYGIYTQIKQGHLTLEQLATGSEFKATVEAAGRVAVVASKLVDDPSQSKNIASLLSSI